MSFAIWQEKPPFDFAKNDPEQIYKVGSVWVVTDDPAKANQAAVDAVLNAPIAKAPISDGALAQILVAKGLLTQQDVGG